MKGFKGLNSILEVYNTSFDQGEKIFSIDIIKGSDGGIWPGLPFPWA